MAPSRKAIGRGASHTGTSKLRSATPDAPVVANGVSPTRNRAGNDVSQTASRKSKRLHSTKGSTKPTSFLDRILRTILLSLAIYALLVCPSDTRLESPTCRAIHSWRLTLEPYVLKPVISLASHSSVQPVIQKVKPHYDEAVRRATPILRTIQRTVEPRIHALRSRTRSVSQPYIRTLQLEYDSRLQPYVAHFEPYYRTTHRYTIRQWAAIRAELGPFIGRARIFLLGQWENTIKPKVLVPAWECLQGVPVWLDMRFGDQARSLKSTYIDEQIKKMHSKIEELGSHSTVSGVIPTATTSSMIGSPRVGVISEMVSSAVEGIESRATSATAPVEKFATESIMIVEDVASSLVATTPAHSLSEEPTTAPSRIVPAAESTVSSSKTPNLEAAARASSGSGASESVPSPAPDAVAQEDDPLEFLALFTAKASPTVSSDVPLWTGPSEEEIARRKRETAEKRRNLEKRHADWEAKVEGEGEGIRNRLVNDIMRIRSDAVTSLSETADDPDSVGAQVAAFRAEGAKALRGTRAYVDKLMTGHYHGAEKIGLLDNVVKKVEQRYTEGAHALSEKIATWWAAVRDEVTRLVIQAGEDIKGVALDGQADMGMDYSYLDDVSARDWTRYHDLVNRAKDFLTRYQIIAEGTAINAPADPLPSALTELQINLRDTLAQFQADLTVIREESFGQIKGSHISTSLTKSSPGERPILPVAGAHDAFVGRGREEILQAMGRAGEEVAATGSSRKPFPSNGGSLQNADGVVDATRNEADVIYGRTTVHEVVCATSSVTATFSETTDNVAAEATSAVFSVNGNVRTSDADAYAEASFAIHSAVRNVADAAGAQVETEDAEEYLESIAEDVMAIVHATAVSSAAHPGSRLLPTAGGAEITPEVPKETMEDLEEQATPPGNLAETGSFLQTRASSLAKKASAAASDARPSTFTAVVGTKAEEL